jgi:branched-chain amino acid transport system substrate-binding protein
MQFKTIKIIPLAGAMAFAMAGTVSAQEQIVKIGHVAPTSGPDSHMGKDNENGAKMAIDDLNAKSVMIGGKKVKFELLAEDDASDPKQGTAAAQKLVDAKINGVIGHLNSGTTIPASKIYFDAGIPQISPSATNPKYTQQGFNTAFRICANDGQIGGTLGRYAVQEIKARKIAVIDDATAYGQGIATEFTKSAKSKSADIVAMEHTTNRATDFNAILTKIKGTHPDLIFFGGMDAVGGPMLRQMKTLGIKAKFMGGDGICTEEAMVRLAGDAIADGQVICAEAGGVTAPGKKALADWKAAYKKKFGIDVENYAPYVYDAVMTMVEAMKNAGSAEPVKYLPFLAKIKYKGVTGNIEFDQNGDIKNGAMTLYTYNRGKREEIAVMH